MGRKKIPHKKKPIQQTVITQEVEAAAGSILRNFENADPLELVARVPDSHHALAVIEKLCQDPSPSIPLLLAFKEGFKDKQVQKAIKRAIYKLRKRGIPVEEFSRPESGPSIILKPSQEERPAAYVGPVLNMSGSRAVFITHYRAIKGQYIGMGVVSDEEGIQEFLYGAFGKKRTREIKDDFSEKAGPLVETSLSHAATILEYAYQRHPERHVEPSSKYLELRPWLLENAPLLGRPAIYDLIPEAQVANMSIARPQLERLFQHKLFEAWLIRMELLRPFMEQLIQAEESPIVLTDAQKDDQARRIKEKCLAELFPDAERDLLKRRLEEMAFVFFKLKEVDFCRLCLDAAQGIAQSDNLLRINPVIEFFLERSINYYMNLILEGFIEKEPTGSSSPGIIIP